MSFGSLIFLPRCIGIDASFSQIHAYYLRINNHTNSLKGIINFVAGHDQRMRFKFLILYPSRELGTFKTY